MPNYGPWTWSAPHNRHYLYVLADDGVTVLDTLWSGPATASATPQTTAAAQSHESRARTPRTGVDVPVQFIPQHLQLSSGSSLQANATISLSATTYPSQSNDPGPSSGQLYESINSGYDTRRSEIYNFRQQQHGYEAGIGGETNYTTESSGLPSPQSYPSAHPSMTTGLPSQPGQIRSASFLPFGIQSAIQSLDRRYIQTNPKENSNYEQLDTRYRRVPLPSRAAFFVCGRVFKMLWTEPAGQVNPGKVRNSTHLSTVPYGEIAFSEIRRFLVVRNKGDFSQCVPIQTYRGRGAAKPGLRMSDHGVIHTTTTAPNLLPGEALTKYPIQVQPTEGEYLEPESRVNYGKAYAVEHNVKVLDIGMVIEGHRYLAREYFDAAMQAE